MPLSNDIADMWKKYGFAAADFSELNAEWKTIADISPEDEKYMKALSKDMEDLLKDIRKDIHIMESVLSSYNSADNGEDFTKYEGMFFGVLERAKEKLDDFQLDLMDYGDQIDDL